MFFTLILGNKTSQFEKMRYASGRDLDVSIRYKDN